MTSKFDITTARQRFPALKGNQVFFDNAGGSQILSSVVESIQKFLLESNVQLGATYPVGQLSTRAFGAGYDAAAKFVNAGVGEIVIGPSATQLFRNLSLALTFPPASEIIISSLDHEANIAPWLDIARHQNLSIRWWTPSPSSTNPKLTPENLKPLLSERTRLVTLTHASNILGTIHDVKAISKLVHTISGAMVCIDAVAYAPHRRIDMQELGADFYCFSWYKVFGPHCSLLYGSTEAQKNLTSLGHYFNPTTTLADKLTLGSYHYELTSSIPSVLSYLSPGTTTTTAESLSSTYTLIATFESHLASILLTYLNSKSSNDEIIIYGERTADPKKRVSTVSFRIKGCRSSEVVAGVERVSGGRFGVRWGAFYSARLVGEVLGLGGDDGVVRVSMVHYNTVEEVESFIEVLDEVISSKK